MHFYTLVNTYVSKNQFLEPIVGDFNSWWFLDTEHEICAEVYAKQRRQRRRVELFELSAPRYFSLGKLFSKNNTIK